MKLLSTLILSLFSILSFAGGDVHGTRNPNEKTYVPDIHWMPNKNYQAELRSLAPWKNFITRNGNWWVLFNEENRKPHRAFGTPIATTGTDAQDRAMNFITTELVDFKIPVSSLELQGISENSKHRFVNFTQKHNGVKVLESRLTVKLTTDNKVIMFGADVFNDIQISTIPNLSSAAAGTFAMSGIMNESILSTVVSPELAILPIPENKANVYHLVYIVNVETQDADGIPANYYTLVDAVSGEVLYRQNMVVHFHGKKEEKSKTTIAPPPGIDVTIDANVYATHSYNPATFEVLPNLAFSIGASNFNTDLTGFAGTGITGPQNATFALEGFWADVRTSNVTPTQTILLADGVNNVSFTAGTIQQRSAYRSVNIVHDHCVAVLPGFTGMDFTLPTNVDLTTGNCNAFYNGTSINFYSQANGCTSFATVADVVYHEYGHGINDNFYSDGGSNFMNGAMGEGYADFWAYSITLNAIVGEGTSTTSATSNIRRYDIDKKVYPIDIVGEVHSDGEIIAGAWWDTYLNLGNDMNLTLQLFAGAYPGFQAATFNGNEGKAYTDVLIDVLQFDDTDADLTNGTPNGIAIVDAFALHGITLISNATLTHTPIPFASSGNTIPITATLGLTFPYTDYLQDVLCFYKINTGAYTSVPMTNISGNTYSIDVPAQTDGTIISYYMGAEDINGLLTAVIPIGAEMVDPNLPYHIMVGFQLEKTDDVADFVNELGSWQTGLPSDNNTTGDWEANIPIGSFSTAGDTSTSVNPHYQHTVGGEICFLTGNAPNATDAVGTNDVDAGHTTLQSATIDMSLYTNPTVSYYRWYINNPASGANPGADWWQVMISNNNGSTWTYVENTKTAQRGWRRNVFRVSDYVTPTANMKIKFIASDSTHLGQNLDGGSLIEAGVDDIQLWDNVNSNAVDEKVITDFQFYLTPNPSDGIVNVVFEIIEDNDVQLIVTDITGKQVMNLDMKKLMAGLTHRKLDLSNLESGVYQVSIIVNNTNYTRKLVLTR